MKPLITNAIFYLHFKEPVIKKRNLNEKIFK